MLEELLGAGLLLPIVVIGYAGNDDEKESSDRISFKYRKEGENFNYEIFRDLVKFGGIDNSYGNEEQKREILKKSGYTILLGKGGEFISIDEAPYNQIGAIFQKQYKAYAA